MGTLVSDRLWPSVLLAGYLLVYILPLAGRPLAIPDETRYAEVPREMIASSDWVVPHLNGLRYFEKPPMGYWCHALAMSIFGQNAFAVRLPSAMAAGGTAVLILLLVRRFGAEPRAGFFAAGALLLCTEVFGVGVFAVLDSLFTFFVTGALVTFFFAYRSQGAARAARLCAMGAFCGLAFLTKGFLAFAIPAVVIAPFLLWERRGRLLFTMPWLPLATAAVTVLPWALAVHRREGDFWHYFVCVEHLRRFAGHDAQHRAPFWFFVPVLLGGAFPWSPLFPAAFQGLRADRLKTPLLRFALCWFAAPFLLLSLSRGKLGTYILPCFAPVMVLTTAGLSAYMRQGRRKALIAGTLAVAGFTAVLAVVVGVLPVDKLGLRLESGAALRQCALALALVAWAALAVRAVRVRQPLPFALRFALGAALFLLTFHLAAGGVDSPGKTPVRCLRAHASDIPRTARIVSSAYLTPAICWAYKRADVSLLAAGAGELAYGLGFPDAGHRELDFDEFKATLEDPTRATPVVLIVDTDRYAEWSPRLPAPTRCDIDDGLVFAFYYRP